MTGKHLVGQGLEECEIFGHLREWRIDGKYFKVDMEGLAAHCEFTTAMIDVSRSKDVAMFFALCEKNGTGQYAPILFGSVTEPQ